MTKFFQIAKTVWLTTAILGLTSGIAVCGDQQSGVVPLRDSSLNVGWKFHREDADAAPMGDISKLDDSSWTTVDLPHSAAIENLAASHAFQGICWYRKTLLPQPGMAGRRITIEVQAAMQLADIWINGEHRLTHEGGYLPFTIDATDDIAANKPVVVTMRLDNRDNPDIPPGRPLDKLDFCYFSGLYRNVILQVTDPLHVTDPVQANHRAGGGVFVRDAEVSDASARIDFDVEVRNDDVKPRPAVLVTTMTDANGKVVLKDTAPETLVAPGASQTISRRFTLPQPHLWSPQSPYLYTLGEKIGDGDEVRQRIGIRTLRTDPKEGFFLNGKHFVPSGANRHQAYPYLGNALSDAAQYRDAVKLKEAGWDLIRLCHYPQSPAFLDACDELGLMVIVCIPGWQHFSDTDHFKNNVIQNLADTIRRDRNHPCAVLWETTLNETNGHDGFFHQLTQVAHREYPGDQMLTCGDAEGHDPDAIGYDVPYSGWDGATHSRPSRAHGAMSLHREYGDNEFGGYSRANRADGERAMLIQAWNYQTALNRELGLPHTWGQCIWEGIDNARGADANIAACGALDLFRLPKFTYAFYQSQRDPAVVSPLFDSGPMVFIANYWSPQSTRDVVVYSNAEEVELFVNGQSIKRRKPDSGPDVPFGDRSGVDLNYWKTNSGFPKQGAPTPPTSPIFNGGNSSHLAHPPFTFSNVAFQPGELKAVAYIHGKSVAEFIRRTAGVPAGVRVSVDLSGKDWLADGADTVFIHAQIQDAQRQPCWTSAAKVKFSLSGPACIIGPDTVNAAAGIGTILVKSFDEPGTVTVTATSPGLVDGLFSMQTKNTPVNFRDRN